MATSDNTTLDVDLCVIGAGSGGLSVAAAAVAFGQRVVLIEKGKMGGDCLNYGCVPSKALIAAGHRAHVMRSSAASTPSARSCSDVANCSAFPMSRCRRTTWKPSRRSWRDWPENRHERPGV